MPGYTINEMGEIVLSAIEEVSVVDVYDLATDIGKECEKLIDSFGADSVAALIPKVINALELLEALATRNERENTAIQELNDRITQLETEKLEKAEYRKRFDKELEAIEEQWRAESRELVALVSRLQEENKRLAKQQTGENNEILGTTVNSALEQSSPTVNDSNTSDIQILQRLKSQVDKHRNELKDKDQELEDKLNVIENLNLQIERLKVSGRESRRRQKVLQVQIRALCEERADFFAQLQDQHREIVNLKKRLGIAEKENEDLTKTQDEDDTLRPRFTTVELKDILSERDDLKTRINDLEEELKICKPDTVKDTKRDPITPTEEDPPVQGPLPFEPDDAPWKKNSESGIRKFFRKLFSEPGTTSFPRRSLSTLSKMALSGGPHCDIPM